MSPVKFKYSVSVKPNPMIHSATILPFMRLFYNWCREHLSSEGVLWSSGYFHDHSYWNIYFRESEDAVLFRLTFGI